jgi:Fe-S cluster assembly protein SufB
MSEKNKDNDVISSQDDYKYGFHDDNVKAVIDTGKGLNEDIVRQISHYKNEPEWMTEFRVNSFHAFEKMPMPKWGPDLSEIDFQDFTYYKKVSKKRKRAGMKYRKKSRILLKSLVFRKQKENICPV